MSTENKLDTSNNESPMFGHGTIVYRRGDMVEKQHRANGEFTESADVWMYKMQKASEITDRLRALGNSAYVIPKTEIKNGKVYEEFARGTKLSDLSDEYIAQNKDWIISAVANLLNDLSEMEPVEKAGTDDTDYEMTATQYLDVDEIVNILSRRADVIGRDNITFIKSVYKYLLALPENQELVFSHNDLSGGNVFIDTENRRVSFIDFEVAGYDTKLHIMYHSHFLTKIPGVWEYINTKLKRTKNKNLKWNYSAAIMQLYEFVWKSVFAVLENDDRIIKNIASECNDVRKLITDKKLKFNIAMVNVSQQNTSQINHIRDGGYEI